MTNFNTLVEEKVNQAVDEFEFIFTPTYKLAPADTETFKENSSEWIKNKLTHILTTTAQRVREETLKEAKEKEAYEWFDAWFSHYKAPLTDKSVQNFGKWATERLQTLGYERQQPEEHLSTLNK